MDAHGFDIGAVGFFLTSTAHKTIAGLNAGLFFCLHDREAVYTIFI